MRETSNLVRPAPIAPYLGFSGIGRMLALLLAVPALLLLDRPADLGASLALAVLFWILAGRARLSLFRSMRAFLWFAPALVLSNGLLLPGPKIWGPFTRPGLVTGLLVAYRFAWAAWLATTLIRTCPPLDLLDSLRAIFAQLRIPDHGISVTLFLTIEMLPQFADIRVKDFRNLPEAIATRIQNVVVPEIPANLQTAPQARLKLADLVLILPAAAVLVLGALV